MIKLIALVVRFAGEVDAEFFENARVDLGEYHGGVHFQSSQVL
jgi:hypothetical protein